MKIYNIQKNTGDVIAGALASIALHQIIVASTAGEISIYSNGTNDGRGIWLPAHGTAQSGKNVMYVDTNNNITIYTHEISGQILKSGESKSWIAGRDGAGYRVRSINSYSPAISLKTTNGSWEMGAYNNANYTDYLIFNWADDTKYASSTNAQRSVSIKKPPSDGSYAVSLAAFSLSGTTLTITDPFAT